MWRSHVDVVVTYDEIVDTLESAPVNPSDRINCSLIYVIILVIACLLLLVGHRC